MLGSVPDDGIVVVADLEAGIGTLTRLAGQTIDLVIVVVEPTPRSIDVATRAVEVAVVQGPTIVVGNKVAGEDDAARIHASFPDALVTPLDPVIDEADRVGRSPMDADDGRAVGALGPLVDRVAALVRPARH